MAWSFAGLPRDLWPRSPDGGLTMFTRQLDLDSSLTETGGKK